jgi:hypothetical protein
MATKKTIPINPAEIYVCLGNPYRGEHLYGKGDTPKKAYENFIDEHGDDWEDDDLQFFKGVMIEVRIEKVIQEVVNDVCEV